MNIKKYLYIGIGVFLLIVFLAAGTTAEFRLSNITSDVYAYIEKFFSQWSPTLSAAGTIIVAALAFVAYWQGRRSERLDLDRQYLFQVEEWVESERHLLGDVEHLSSVEPDIEFRIEMARIGAQVRQRGALMQSAVHALGNSSLQAEIDRYWDLRPKFAGVLDRGDEMEIKKHTNTLKDILDQILSIVNDIRSKILK